MRCCTFFGNKDAGCEIEQTLYETIENLIAGQEVHIFYVGNQGNFDTMVKKCLRRLKIQYPEIKYSVVLAYMPQKANPDDIFDFSDTIFPDGLESVPPRYAIYRRNQWMLAKSDIVVTYVRYTFGGAAIFKEKAQKAGKTVIEIA